MIKKRYHNNTEIYHFCKGVFSLKEVHVSIGEYEEEREDDKQVFEYDVNVCVWYVDKYLNSEFESFTPITYSTLKEAEKHAKGIYRTLEKRFGEKISYQGLENC